MRRAKFLENFVILAPGRCRCAPQEFSRGFGGRQHSAISDSNSVDSRRLKRRALDDTHINSALHPLVTDRYAAKASQRNAGGFVGKTTRR